jgi:tRNA/tmRNA/rRNA uracil-C5-methylase (TrmA/RlmC/RlmD family)
MQNEVLLENLFVESYANEGKCVGHHEGKVVFVKGTIPGELVHARVKKNKKDWMEAEVTVVIKASLIAKFLFASTLLLWWLPMAAHEI